MGTIVMLGLLFLLMVNVFGGNMLDINSVCNELAQECGSFDLKPCLAMGEECVYMNHPAEVGETVLVCGREGLPIMNWAVMGCWVFEGRYVHYMDLYPEEEYSAEEEIEWDDRASYEAVNGCINVEGGCVPVEQLVEDGVCEWSGEGDFYLCDPYALQDYKVEEGPSLVEVMEELASELKQYLPKLKERIQDAWDYVEYLAQVEGYTGKKVGDEQIILESSNGFDWGAYERMMAGVGYKVDEDEAEIWESNPELLRTGAREQIARKAVVMEGVKKAEELLNSLESAEAEGYEHGANTGWGTFMFLLDMLQAGAYSTVSKAEAIKSAAESLATNQMDNLRNVYMDEDNVLALGAKFALQAHQGYAEARATGLGYPPHRFLYGCKKGEYSQYKCTKDEETAVYHVTINGKEVVVSHFVRMKDKDGNIYWVGTDDPEAVDEEAAQHPTLILKEVNGWLWKSDNVEIIDPESGKVLSEEDLPGMFG